MGTEFQSFLDEGQREDRLTSGSLGPERLFEVMAGALFGGS